MKTQTTRDNSQEIQLTNNKLKRTCLIHNLVAEHFLDPIEGKNFVGHINRNKKDNRVVNLVRVSLSELNTMAKNFNKNNNMQ